VARTSTKAEKNREQGRNEAVVAEDPVLAMLGVGKQLWESESGDSFIERLRSENLPAPPTHLSGRPPSKLPDFVWRRISKYQSVPFRTATGLPFTYEVEGTGIWFFRDGKRVNRKLTRKQFEMALSRCPLSSTTEIKDLIDYPYLFAVLMDPRIRAQEW